MKNLSGYGVKRLLPIFIEGIKKDNWRSKMASSEALGHIAYCAPRQLSFFLPDIVKSIWEVLNDTHPKVQESGIQALTDISTAIQNPEISDLAPELIWALSDASNHLNTALNILLDTNFIHAIDAPSLSLLIPIIESGLRSPNHESKKKSTRVVGHICSLTSNPLDLLPYMEILIPSIKVSLFDPIPEIRAFAAKSLGTMTKGLGLQNSSIILKWLIDTLENKDLQAKERSGAAQGLAEVLSFHGKKFFEERLPKLIQKCTSDSKDDSFLWESYMSVFIYLPTCYSDFERHLTLILPIFYQGLSDEQDEIRKLSNRVLKICVECFGK